MAIAVYTAYGGKKLPDCHPVMGKTWLDCPSDQAHLIGDTQYVRALGKRDEADEEPVKNWEMRSLAGGFHSNGKKGGNANAKRAKAAAMGEEPSYVCTSAICKWSDDQMPGGRCLKETLLLRSSLRQVRTEKTEAQTSPSARLAHVQKMPPDGA